MIKISVEEIYRDILVEAGEKARELGEKYGYRPYMVQRYLYILGLNETIELLNAFEKKTRPVVRTNTVIIDSDRLSRRLRELGFILREVSWASYSFYVERGPVSPSIGATHEYLKGYYYVHRDSASLIPSIILLHEYRGEVLDLCAAPGGKATHMAQLLGDKYTVYANDLVLYRLESLVNHVIRMGYKSIRILWSDARKLYRLMDKRFERILLDAPCSGEGTIMLDPGRKTRTRTIDLARIVKREIELLDTGLNMLKPGGVLAYTTCSIAPEENEYVVSKILMHRNDVEVIESPVKLFNWSGGLTSYHRLLFDNGVRHCIRVWPHRHNMIGLTICLLMRTRR